MKHLSPDELIDAVEGRLISERQSHLAACGSCESHVSQLRMVLGEARRVTVPDPSPLFWDRFSARVHDRIANEPSPSKRWAPDWFRWPVLAPIAALAVLLLGLATLMPRQSVEQVNVAVLVPQDSASDLASLGEQEWAMVSESVGPLDLDVAHEAGLVRLGDAERAALGLSAAEQRELLRLLEQEMEKAGS